MTFAAFEITQEDVENVLRNHLENVVNPEGEPLEAVAKALFDQSAIDFARVEKAALDSSCDLDEQTQGAYDEIKDILVEIGALAF